MISIGNPLYFINLTNNEWTGNYRIARLECQISEIIEISSVIHSSYHIITCNDVYNHIVIQEL